MDDSFGRHVTDGLTPESGPKRQRRRFPSPSASEAFNLWTRETLRAEGSIPCPAVEPATPEAPMPDTRLDGSDRV